MSDTLSQAEVDALMAGNASAKDEHQDTGIDEKAKQDIIGEVGNISMSQAATTLSSILNRRVSITTPRVSKLKFEEVLAGVNAPKVATIVEFKEGLAGSNLFLLEVKDAVVIADLMMGGDGNPTSDEFGELQLSAVAEAMNQMIGSASTSMATMINKKVDILPPSVKLWEDASNIEYKGIVKAEEIYRISFSLSVEGLIESEIMQIFTEDMVKDISNALLSDKATVIERDDTAAKTQQPEKKPVPKDVAAEAPKKASVTGQSKRVVEVSKPEFQQLEENKAAEGDNLDLLLDVPLNLSVVLGRSEKTIRDILSFNSGSVIELDRLTDEPLEILLNGKPIATGEVVVINENFGIRITNILSPSQRIHRLK
ncbi:flagellar motor switch phosphatase FliY [Liquorilactobacillus satsumensis]|uniref:flagellar motor switch phosphatase FliY n=1 Tax=Liquorilactobacillus satsumensis TaxID=259059 RepID=UPI001E60EF07|nr:flagellar motor switch phosphatase FliY [Liquorilactobacillus satsumensis]MCC7666620.1 flagellar motor switch phosphatase FliY [Liquorilactobacillus satsumensis]MCP9357819.1 flagellar motor switch phosphatase FliY [Liquorilactobacillus satsumensis]MCP9371559.1 flagellar motor switch phosphatase FliY [Liquorilactobacillus satsumensis]